MKFCSKGNVFIKLNKKYMSFYFKPYNIEINMPILTLFPKHKNHKPPRPPTWVTGKLSDGWACLGFRGPKFLFPKRHWPLYRTWTGIPLLRSYSPYNLCDVRICFCLFLIYRLIHVHNRLINALNLLLISCSAKK